MGEQVWDISHTSSDLDQSQLVGEEESVGICHEQYLASKGWPLLQGDLACSARCMEHGEAHELEVPDCCYPRVPCRGEDEDAARAEED